MQTNTTFFLLLHDEKILMVCHGNREVKLGYKALKEKVKEYNKKDAKLYGNMFAKLNKAQPIDSKA